VTYALMACAPQAGKTALERTKGDDQRVVKTIELLRRAEARAVAAALR
jgi:hypothetical protein